MVTDEATTHEVKPLTTITSKHRKFVKRVMEGETYAQAAASAGFRGMGYGSRLMHQPAIRSLLMTQMEKAGINDTLIAKKLRDGLDAMAPPRKDGGRQYEDQFVRKQFLDVIFKVRGDYAPEKTVSTEKSITIIMDGRMIEALRDSRAIECRDADVLDAEIVEDGEIIGESNANPGELPQDCQGAGEPGPLDQVVSDGPLLSVPDDSPDAGRYKERV